MTEREITELAAILVNEHGRAAVDVAERRRTLYADRPQCHSFRLWNRIAGATARLVHVDALEHTDE